MLIESCAIHTDYHYRSKSGCQKADRPGAQLQQGLRIGAYLSLLRGLYGQVYGYYFDCDGVL